MPAALSPTAHPFRRPCRIGAGIAPVGLVATAGVVGCRAGRSVAGPGRWLRSVARIVADLRQIPGRLRRYGVQLGEISASVTGLVRGLAGMPEQPPADAVRVIWLSDVHNNPVAFAVAEALARQRPGAVVVDTGDIGDWGRAVEARMYTGIAEIPAPYVFIKGNHDGPRTLAALEKLPNVVILDRGATYEHDGLVIAGDADPRFTPDKSTGDDHFGADRLARIGQSLAVTLAPLEPDVVLVHDPVVAAQLAGVAPLVLSGHTHKRDARSVAGTLILTQGSSGGVGLRGVRQLPPTPLEISVLHIDRASKRLHSVDELTIGGLGLTEVSLLRRAARELGRPRASLEKA